MCGSMYAPSIDGSNITLIGVDFRDREEGLGKLEQLLHKLKPTLIVHPFSEEDHQELTRALDETGSELLQKGVDPGQIEDAVEKLYDLIIPFPVAVGNEYAQENGIKIAYGQRPYPFLMIESRIDHAKRLATDLVESAQKGKLGNKALWQINNALHQYYGPIPSEEKLESQWEYLNAKEGFWKQSMHNIIDQQILNPGPNHPNKLMKRIIKELAQEEGIVAIPMRMQNITTSVGSIYNKTKGYGVQRIPLLYSSIG